MAKQTELQHPAGKTKVRSIWISDVHLGTPGCQAEALAQFLGQHDCDYLYLVGDIIDGWQLKKSFFWPQEHTNVVRKILTRAKRGTKVVYITGNHDEFLRKFVDYKLDIGNIELANEVVHTTADGRKFLVLHGDIFDVITRYHRWIARAGDSLYNSMMLANRHLNRVRRSIGLPYFSLSAYAKKTVKSAVNIVTEFEESVARECDSRQLDGAICGHIHHAEIREIGNSLYLNCGDWVESCTALVEDQNGDIRIVHWPNENIGRENARVVEFRAKPKAA
ncbi:MAG: UDP-2,3-diacylglucosamine diphosphatase [Oceanococcus sp.]